MKKIIIVVTSGMAIAALWAMPAVGGPSIIQLEKREKQHYKSLDSRIKAAALFMTKRIYTNTQSAYMTQSPSGRTFSGSVGCNSGEAMTGGGVDWGTSPTTYSGWHVVSSTPGVGGVSWSAQVDIGNSPGPSTLPQVYAVCAKL